MPRIVQIAASGFMFAEMAKMLVHKKDLLARLAEGFYYFKNYPLTPSCEPSTNFDNPRRSRTQKAVVVAAFVCASVRVHVYSSWIEFVCGVC